MLRREGRKALKKWLVENADVVETVKRHWLAASYTHRGQDFPHLFSCLDADRSGFLDFAEFQSAVRRQGQATEVGVVCALQLVVL